MEFGVTSRRKKRIWKNFMWKEESIENVKSSNYLGYILCENDTEYKDK